MHISGIKGKGKAEIETLFTLRCEEEHLSKVKERAFLRSHDFGNSLTSAVSARLSVLSFTILQIDQASPGPCKYPGKRVKNIIT